MAYKVSITPLTFFEIDEAIFWYEKQLSGLGRRFLNEVNDTIVKVQAMPENYLVIYPPVRRTVLKNFLTSYTISLKTKMKLLFLLYCTRSEIYAILNRE